MMIHSFFLRRLALVALTTWSVAPIPSAGTDLSDILDHSAPAVVTVQLVLQVKISGAMGQVLGEDQEFETETTCTIVDPKGLVLCSNTQINGYVEVMQRMTGRLGAQSGFVATPTQIKVLLGDQGRPLSAKLLVRDTDLDLAWLQIENPGSRQFAYVDFAQSTTPRVGETLFAIRRLDKFFDRNPSLMEARVGSVTQKPRKLYIPTGNFETHLGLPVLTSTGQPLGLLVLQLPDESGARNGGSLSLEMMSWSARMQDVGRSVILPAQEILKATRRAIASLADESTKP